MKTNLITIPQKFISLLGRTILMLALFSTSVVFAQQKDTSNADDETLINQFIKAKGYPQTIIFDSTNIKQFWTDRNIISRNKQIEVILNANNKLQTSPQKIQLANVLETQDCKVDIITENDDMSFSVVDSNAKVLSNSSAAEEFLQYNVLSSTFHIEDLNDFSFGIVFSSPKLDVLQIKKIVLSFSVNENSAYAGSPGFDQLLKQIDEKGVAIPQVYENGDPIPDSEASYLISKENNKMYIKIPSEQAEDSGMFVFRIFPTDKKDIENQGSSNTYDFHITPTKNVIPKPYLSKSPFTIVQCSLPSYPYSKIRLGLTRGKGKDRIRLWFIYITDGLPQ